MDKSLKRKSLSSKSLVKGKISKVDSKMELNATKNPEPKDKKDKKDKPKSGPNTSTGIVIPEESSPRKEEKKPEDKPKSDVTVDIKAVEGEVKVDAAVEVNDGSQTPKDKKRRKKRDGDEKKDENGEAKAGDEKTGEVKHDEHHDGQVAVEGSPDAAAEKTKEERREEREKRRKEKREREEKEEKKDGKEPQLETEKPKDAPKKEHGYNHIKCVTNNFLFWKSWI